MKPELLLVAALTSSLVMLSGCQSGSKESMPQSSAGQAAAESPAAAVTAASPVVTNALPAIIRIKAGASALKESSGNEWLGDTGFAGGEVIERPDLPIADTKQPEVYRSEHYSMDSFGYALPNGKYQVKLHFCETFEGITGPGGRVFSFDVEGKAFKDFDVWAKSGGFARPYVETVPVEITDGKLDIKFTPNIENPQINGIEITPVK